jgi:hypothetical protein
MKESEKMSRIIVRQICLMFCLFLCKVSVSQIGEISFNKSNSPNNIESIFVVGMPSELCDGNTSDSEGMAEYVSTRLLGTYEILERKHLISVFDEHKLGMSGLLDENTIVEAGLLNGAEGIVICQESCLDGQLLKSVKLVDCTNGNTLWAASGIDAFMKDLIKVILNQRSETYAHTKEYSSPLLKLKLTTANNGFVELNKGIISAGMKDDAFELIIDDELDWAIVEFELEILKGGELKTAKSHSGYFTNQMIALLKMQATGQIIRIQNVKISGPMGVICHRGLSWNMRIVR